MSQLDGPSINYEFTSLVTFANGKRSEFKKKESLRVEEKGNGYVFTFLVRKWMKKNHYTWHEVDENGKMEKVPSIVHGNVCHAGGVSEKKKSNRSLGTGLKL